MVQGRLIRLFWISAAAIVVIAGLFALAAVLGGNFDETDSKILGALGTALLGGAVATAGGSLVESSLAPRFGRALAGLGLVASTICIAAIWNGFDSEGLARTAGASYVLLAAGLMVGTARALVGGRSRLVPLSAAVSGLSFVWAGLSVGAIAAGHASSGYVKGIAAVWILAGIAYVLIPIARRLAPEASAPGVRQIDLAAGADAAGTRVRLATGRATLGRETVVIVLAGGARVGSAELGPGDAVVAGAGTEVEIGGQAQVLLVGG